MTETVEGVRDPLRVNADHENVAVKFALHPRGFSDWICPVDDEGYVRWPESEDRAGEVVPWHSYTILGYDVDPDTWGDQYHHPDDCPEIGRCSDCTVAADREHDPDHYRTDLTDVQPVDIEEIQRAVKALDVNGEDHPDEIMVVTKETTKALRDELEDDT